MSLLNIKRYEQIAVNAVARKSYPAAGKLLELSEYAIRAFPFSGPQWRLPKLRRPHVPYYGTIRTCHVRMYGFMARTGRI